MSLGVDGLCHCKNELRGKPPKGKQLENILKMGWENGWKTYSYVCFTCFGFVYVPMPKRKKKGLEGYLK